MTVLAFACLLAFVSASSGDASTLTVSDGPQPQIISADIEIGSDGTYLLPDANMTDTSTLIYNLIGFDTAAFLDVYLAMGSAEENANCTFNMPGAPDYNMSWSIRSGDNVVNVPIFEVGAPQNPVPVILNLLHTSFLCHDSWVAMSLKNVHADTNAVLMIQVNPVVYDPAPSTCVFRLAAVTRPRAAWIHRITALGVIQAVAIFVTVLVGSTFVAVRLRSQDGLIMPNLSLNFVTGILLLPLLLNAAINLPCRIFRVWRLRRQSEETEVETIMPGAPTPRALRTTRRSAEGPSRGRDTYEAPPSVYAFGATSSPHPFMTSDGLSLQVPLRATSPSVDLSDEESAAPSAPPRGALAGVAVGLSEKATRCDDAEMDSYGYLEMPTLWQGPEGSQDEPREPVDDDGERSIGSASTASLDVPCCRVCRETKDETDRPLIAPCACTGSMRWIHRDCLDRWRQTAAEGGRTDVLTACEVCHAELRVPTPPPRIFTPQALALTGNFAFVRLALLELAVFVFVGWLYSAITRDVSCTGVFSRHISNDIFGGFGGFVYAIGLMYPFFVAHFYIAAKIVAIVAANIRAPSNRVVLWIVGVLAVFALVILTLIQEAICGELLQAAVYAVAPQFTWIPDLSLLLGCIIYMVAFAIVALPARGLLSFFVPSENRREERHAPAEDVDQMERAGFD